MTESEDPRGSRKERKERAAAKHRAGQGSAPRRGQAARKSDDTGKGGAGRKGAGARSAGPRKNDRPKQAGRPDPSEAGLDPARLAARDVLRAVRERDAYANLVLPGLLRDRRLDTRDSALATELAYGTSRARGILDVIIASAAGRDITEIDGPVLDVLRLGAYQLLRTRVAPHAAVATSVDMARAGSGGGAAGFVNAVLRRVSEKTVEQWTDQLAPSADKDPVGRLAFAHAHPAWIAQAFSDALGADAGELSDALVADDTRPAVHLVARPGEISAEELALVTGGEVGLYSPYAVYLDGGDPGRLDAVRDGLAGVQDEGSQLVARTLTVAPIEGADGGRWLDLCAGPGGKAALLGAIAAIDGARVDAVEPAEHRAELVRKTARDLPVDVHVADGRESGLTPGYDRVLVDAPCTGLGALRRRPEARWRRQPGDVAQLVKLQRELLAAAVELVRPGGVILYSTCSPHLSETLGVVADAVRRHALIQVDARSLLSGVPTLGDGPHVQLWPHRQGTDAMFMAVLIRPSDTVTE